MWGRAELPWQVQSKLQKHEQVNDGLFLKPLSFGWFVRNQWISESASQYLKRHSWIGLTICGPFPSVSEARRGDNYDFFFLVQPVTEFVHWSGPYNAIESETWSWRALPKYLLVFSKSLLRNFKKNILESTKGKLGIEFKPHDSPSICILLTPVVSNTLRDTDHWPEHSRC